MSMTHRLVQFALVTTTMLLSACASAAAPTIAPTAASTALVQSTTTLPTMVSTAVVVEPVIDPASTRAALMLATAVPAQSTSSESSMKVGLITDTDGVSDQGYNQFAWEGIQQAAGALGFEATYLESQEPGDYESNIDALASEGTGVIITVGSQMANATAVKARQYPNIRFAIVDHAYRPSSGSPACAETVLDCYADGGLTNVTSLMFAEDQLGFLAGVLAGGMSKTGFVCSITSVPPPASDRYIMNFRGGATWQGGEEMRGMNHYINIQTQNSNMPNAIDATEGQETAQRLIGEGCDVIFGVGADGALVAAQQNNVMAIGADVDQFHTVPAAQNALLSSARKRVDIVVYNYLMMVAAGSDTAGISTGTLQNGGIGLAPFHNWDSQITADLRAQIQQASDGIMNGSITFD